MKLSIYTFLVGCLSIGNVGAQIINKSPLDTNILDSWSRILLNPLITNDGKHVVYVSQKNEKGAKLQSEIFLKSTASSYNFRISTAAVEAEDIFFSNDNNWLFWRSKDTLNSLNLVSHEIKRELGIERFIRTSDGTTDWIAYNTNNNRTQIVLLNINDGHWKRFDNVTEMRFDKNGKKMFYAKDTVIANKSSKSLNLYDLHTNQELLIYKIPEVLSLGNFIFDNSGNQIAFILKDSKSNKVNSVYLYISDGIVQKRIEKVSTDSALTSLSAYRDLNFSKNDKYLFFIAEYVKPRPKQDPNAVNLNVWSYKDVFLQPEQIGKRISQNVQIVTCFNISKRKYFEVSAKDAQLVIRPENINGDFTVIRENSSNAREYWWTLGEKPIYWLVNLNDGKKVHFDIHGQAINFQTSTFGGWITYWNCDKFNYFGYNINNKKHVNLTEHCPTTFATNYVENVYSKPVDNILAWSNDESFFYVYDTFDLWKVSTSKGKQSFCVTEKFGFKNSIKLRLLNDENFNFVVDGKKDNIYIGFNEKTKHNGFLIQKANLKGLQILTMGPNCYYFVPSQVDDQRASFSALLKPIKSKNSNKWVLSRESFNSTPNIYISDDLVNFKPVSDYHPNTDFNWISAELISWKMLDGNFSQGILYKPENFDSTKKYPLIFTYYEKLSHRLFQFPFPEAISNEIDIPYFVSNGYLIFVPDIYYSNASKSGITVGQNACNSVVSAAKYFCKKNWIDTKGLAIYGHSFGGLQTSYLATHSKMFAASCIFAGSTDPISAYLTLVPFGTKNESYSTQTTRERGHELYGTHPWNKPNLYRENSAVLNADKVNSAVLIVHNMSDNNINFRQGLELYMALRRLGKPCWMLEYENSSHSLFGADQMDFTVRLKQFFDHYLKKKIPPRWLTTGVPASLKGLDRGLDLDGENKP